jgi:medium-chain acyl-[acyl-carrier-protein] hydrolase
MKPLWKEEITIRSYDVDCKNKLKISSLCNYFQEVAEHHADDLGFGFDHMQQSGLVWVLSRLEITIESYPEWGDQVTLETWPAGNERLYYRREFMVSGPDGKKIIAASYFWLLINIQNRRPKLLPLPDEIEKSNKGRFAVQVMTGAIPVPGTGQNIIIPIRYGDLDMNRHVNNVRYVCWIMDLFPVEYHDNYVIEFFRIDIRQEVKANESVQIIKNGAENEFTLEGKNCNTNTTCCQALLKFRER